MNRDRQGLSGATPYVVGCLVVAMLGGLGLWQVMRGLDKRAGLDAYTSEGGHERYYAGMEVRPFQRLRVDGEYDSERQVIIDNMIVDGRNGHFVITPLEIGSNEALLLVNRGWIETGQATPGGVAFDHPGSVSVHGRAGRLPRAGMQMGDPFAGAGDWPKHAVYPDADDIAAQLGRAVLPFVLLLDADEPDGYLRRWQPEEMSASRHFGYAVQWFAMAATLSALLVFNYRRSRKRHG